MSEARDSATSASSRDSASRDTGTYAQLKPEYLPPPEAPPAPTGEGESGSVAGADEAAAVLGSEPSVNSGLKRRADDRDEDPNPRARKALKKRHTRNKERGLCRAIAENRECRFGDGCKFSHDIAEYMKTKEPDLGERCYVFDTWGECKSGVTCRFAGAHTTAELTQVIDAEKVASCGPQDYNHLDHDLQFKLRKGKFPFPLADAYLKAVEEGKEFVHPLKAPPPSDTTTTTTAAGGSTDGQEPAAPAAATATTTTTTTTSTATPDGTAAPAAPATTTTTTTTSSTTVDTDTAKVEGTEETASIETEPTAPATPAASEDTKGKGVAVDADGDVEMAAAGADDSPVALYDVNRKKIDWEGKLVLAPLTTVGNLPFRRICKGFGVDVTVGEMAVARKLLQGSSEEWALLRRHPSEDIFGVQVCGGKVPEMAQCAELLNGISADFVDINVGCPIDLVFNRGMGSALLGKVTKLERITAAMSAVLNCELTVKVRTGIKNSRPVAHQLGPRLLAAGASALTIHGRSREQRYARYANWDYIRQCVATTNIPIIGNGDILSYEEALAHKAETGVAGLMVARGALIKPWIFTEIKEERHWDISATERFEMLRSFANYGLEHWGSDQRGIDTTRRFMLEWMSFSHRYIPVGLLERVPVAMNDRPPKAYIGRSDLETLLGSRDVADWIRITEMLLGPVPGHFHFVPKHKSGVKYEVQG